MKVLLAGAFGNLGFEILKALTEKGCEVVAADLKEKENNGLEGKYTFRSIDATNPETLKGLCDGAEVVITTMGLTTASTKFTSYDIDYHGNLNPLEAEGEETQLRGRPILLETGTVKNELSRKLTRPSLRFQKISS